MQHLDKSNFYHNQPIGDKYYTVKTINGFAVALDTVTCQTGRRIAFDGVDYLHFEDYDVEFYQEKEPGHYAIKEYEIIRDEDQLLSIFKIHSEDNETISKEDLKEYADLLINTRDIKTQSVKQLLQTLSKTEWRGTHNDKDGLKYKSLGDVNNNFISYETIDGEKGWIDINTGKEYPNK